MEVVFISGLTIFLFLLVLLGNEFDINVGLKKKRRKRSEKEKMTPDLFFAKIIEAINSVNFTVDDSDSSDVINTHQPDSNDVIKAKLNKYTNLSNSKKDLKDNPEWNESFSSFSDSNDRKEEWFYASKINQLNSD